MKRIIAISSIFLVSITSQAMETSFKRLKATKSLQTDKSCRKLVKPANQKGAPTHCYNPATILNEEHSLLDLLDEDPKVNLIQRYPGIVMSAAQRILSWINFAKPISMRDPEFNEDEIMYYPVFSSGLAIAGGKRISGQYEAVSAYVNHIKAAARGDGSANKMLLFVGPAGTGKTYFLNIISSVAENLTAQHPDYFLYTYEWTNLKDIPELEPFVHLQRTESGVHEHAYKCPIGESPFSLLPARYRETMLDLSSKRVAGMISMAATPFTEHCPHCHEIKNQILTKYMRDNDIATLSDDDVVDALLPHITIKRLVAGANGTMPKIDAQPRDVDFQGLMGMPNAFVMHQYGPSHVASYNMGKMALAHGSQLMLDEFFRNHKALRDAILNLIENRELSRGGAATIKMDALVVGATNYENLEEARSNETSKAHLDRARLVRMPYLLNPFDEASNLLSMKNIRTVMMQKLGGGAADKEPADIDKLFPLPEKGQSRVGPDGRYKVWFNAGANVEPIHLSPHTLMYIALVATGSRLVVDPKKALDFGERQVINDIAYRDIYTRLQILMGRYNINAADLKDLRSLSRDQKEGDTGMSERDVANVWLSQAILEAQKNGNCLTPDLARKVFLRLLEDGAINYKDNKERIRWTNLSAELLLKFLVPSLLSDVNTGLGAGLGAVTTLYDEVFREILALSRDQRATKYQSSHGEPRPINRERLEEIQKLYRLSEGKTFSFTEIVLVTVSENETNERKRHQGLLRAVTAYLAQRETDKITYDDLVQYADNQEGNSDLRDKHSELSSVMNHELGYCNKCLHAALMVVREAKSRKTQVQ